MLDIFLAHFTENLRTFKGIFMFILRDELYLRSLRYANGYKWNYAHRIGREKGWR